MSSSHSLSESEQLLPELISVLAGLDAEPWKLRPSDDGSVKLLVGSNPGRVKGRLDGAGYATTPLDVPLPDGWAGAWEVSRSNE